MAIQHNARDGSRWRWLAVGTLLAVILGVVGATTAWSDETFECPVTIPPRPGYLPADPARAAPSMDDAVWYGDDDLWTVLPVDGTYQPRKSVWWSEHFPGGHVEERPAIDVRWKRLDADRPDITVEGGTNASTTEDGWFMIAGIDPDEAGCWSVTAAYAGAELSYVYERLATTKKAG